MELSFATKRLRLQCMEQCQAEEVYGSARAAGLRAQLADLDAAVTVADLPAINSYNTLEGELRITFAPGRPWCARR